MESNHAQRKYVKIIKHGKGFIRFGTHSKYGCHTHHTDQLYRLNVKKRLLLVGLNLCFVKLIRFREKWI